MNPDTAQAIASKLDSGPATVRDVRSVGGGDSHAAFALTLGSERLFVKINDASFEDAFRTEADALAVIAATNTVRVPAVLGTGCDAGTAWLALAWLDLGPLDTACAAELGEQLAAMHRSAGDAHGWPDDNWIGGSPQYNARHADWAVFWREQRMAPQLAMLHSRDAALARKVERALESGIGLLDSHTPAPSLLHGDLWGGNAARDSADGAAVIFDPASYHGDRETDLAMTRLFGSYPAAFYAAYEAAWPPPDGHEQRTALYNLYHALNHVNLFGSGYRSLVETHCRAIG